MLEPLRPKGVDDAGQMLDDVPLHRLHRLIVTGNPGAAGGKEDGGGAGKRGVDRLSDVRVRDNGRIGSINPLRT